MTSLCEDLFTVKFLSILSKYLLVAKHLFRKTVKNFSRALLEFFSHYKGVIRPDTKIRTS